jgi:hypothetical protein
MGKRPISMPQLRCLDAAVDTDDAKAGALVQAHLDAFDEDFLRARRARLMGDEEPEKPPPPKKRRPQVRRMANRDSSPVLPGRPAEIVPAEALVRPAPTFTPEPPAIAPRARSMPPAHRRIPKSARLVPLSLDDPDYAPTAAQVVAPPSGSTLNGHGPHEWQAPVRPIVHVVATVRGDVLNYMHARGQIDSASYQAGRRYQALYERAELAGLPTVDITMPHIIIRAIGGDFVRVDARRRAAHHLREVDAAVLAEFGITGLQLLRDILGAALTIEACSMRRGDGDDKQSLRFWGSYFRRCLRGLAVILGFATRDQRPPGQGKKARP